MQGIFLSSAEAAPARKPPTPFLDALARNLVLEKEKMASGS
jgi:hypothetical protein